MNKNLLEYIYFDQNTDKAFFLDLGVTVRTV
jgi:hypothetical protein